jgi:hypothetical protein
MPLALATEWYLVRVSGRSDYSVAHAHDDALLGAGAVCGARLNQEHWHLEDTEASRLRRKVLCQHCADVLSERAGNRVLTAGMARL